MIKLVVFDAVGTLLHPAKPIELTYAELFANAGISAEPAQLREAFRKAFYANFIASESASVLVEGNWTEAEIASIQDPNPATHTLLRRSFATDEADQYAKWRKIVRFCIGLFAAELPDETKESVFEQLWNHFAMPSAWVVDSELRSVIDELAARSIPWVIGSNFDSRLHKILADYPIFERCHRVYDSASMGFEKPDKRFYERIQRDSGVPVESVLMVGDDPVRDYLAPKLYGWNACLVGEVRSTHAEQGIKSETRRLSQVIPGLLNWFSNRLG